MLREFFICAIFLMPISFFAFAKDAAISEPDRKLLQYAATLYNKAEMVHKRVIIDTRNGIPIVAEFPCGDICPDYTVRVIHYELLPGQSCSEQGGVERKLQVTKGTGSFDETFCFPKVLSDNWGKYIK